MPLPNNHIKEQLSVAYVTAVSARAGAQFTETNKNEYGRDGYISKVTELPDGKFTDTGWIFNCQLKSTENWGENEDSIIYDIDSNAYNKLVNWEGITPIFLILLILPKDIQDWLYIDLESLILKKCCHWIRLSGPPTDNISSKRIYIPKSNIFDSRAIEILFDKAKI